MDEKHKNNISKGTKHGKLAAAEKGYFIGSVPPFGYRRWQADDKHVRNPRILVIDEQTSAAVLHSFKAYAEENQSYAEIAAFLNKRGYVTVGGKPFTRETIRQMLTNPIYIGMIAYGRIGSSSQLLFTGKHQPIVSRHLWDQVQTLRAERRSRKSTDE